MDSDSPLTSIASDAYEGEESEHRDVHGGSGNSSDASDENTDEAEYSDTNGGSGSGDDEDADSNGSGNDSNDNGDAGPSSESVRRFVARLQALLVKENLPLIASASRRSLTVSQQRVLREMHYRFVIQADGNESIDAPGDPTRAYDSGEDHQADDEGEQGRRRIGKPRNNANQLLTPTTTPRESNTQTPKRRRYRGTSSNASKEGTPSPEETLRRTRKRKRQEDGSEREDEEEENEEEEGGDRDRSTNKKRKHKANGNNANNDRRGRRRTVDNNDEDEDSSDPTTSARNRNDSRASTREADRRQRRLAEKRRRKPKPRKVIAHSPAYKKFTRLTNENMRSQLPDVIRAHMASAKWRDVSLIMNDGSLFQGLGPDRGDASATATAADPNRRIYDLYMVGSRAESRSIFSPIQFNFTCLAFYDLVQAIAPCGQKLHPDIFKELGRLKQQKIIAMPGGRQAGQAGQGGGEGESNEGGKDDPETKEFLNALQARYSVGRRLSKLCEHTGEYVLLLLTQVLSHDLVTEKLHPNGHDFKEAMTHLRAIGIASWAAETRALDLGLLIREQMKASWWSPRRETPSRRRRADSNAAGRRLGNRKRGFEMR